MSASNDLVAHLDAWLPQTQCMRCGYPHCRAYAEALASGNADINRCPPGGEVTLQALAEILHRPLKPLDPACGVHEARARAVIDEARCIGCRKCLDVCPVGAIVGARKLMHTVLTTECNGCGLCAPPCPVDCIAFVPAAPPAETETGASLMAGRTSGASRASLSHRGPRLDPIAEAGPWPEYAQAETERWRHRAEARRARLVRRHAPRARRDSVFPPSDVIRADIRAALERARRKREGRRP